MNRGLAYLLKKTAIGKLRHLRRRMRDRKGRIVLVFATLLVLAFVVPQVASPPSGEQTQRVARYAELLRFWGPPTLVLCALASALSAGGIYFKPAEVDFLFPAPVSRRQLLLYRIVSRLGIAGVSALWTSVFLTPQASHWYAAMLGLFFWMAFMQLTAQASALVLATVGVRMPRWVRKTITIAFLSLVVGALLVAGAVVPRAGQIVAAVRAAVDWGPTRVATSIARPMVEVFLAEDVVAFTLWMAPATAVLVAIAAVMMLLDAAYLEASLGTSAWVQARLRQLRAGGGLPVPRSDGRSTPPRALPMPPRLGGTGPMAWRQVVSMGRALRSLVATMVVVVPAALVPLLILAMSTDPRREFVTAFAGGLVPTLMMTQYLAFDFRRDLDRMALLKSLPLSPLAVAAAQLVSPTIVFTALQLLLLVGLASVSFGVPSSLVIAIAALLPFANWIVAAVDNTLFLLMPYRLIPEDAGSMPFTGQLMVAMFLKALALGLIGGTSALTGLLLLKAFGGSPLAGVIGFAVVLVLAAIALTALVGRTFASFDVSRDVPA